MSVLSSVIQRGTRAGQPAAASVVIGTLYYVTDEFVLERSTGAAWQSMSLAVPSLRVKEQDAAPNVVGVTEIRVTNGTLVDEGGGAVSINTGGGGSEWTTSAVKAGTDTVTNSTTLTDDSELSIAVVANGCYMAEAIIIYSGNDLAGDYKWGVTFPGAGTNNAQAHGFVCAPSGSLASATFQSMLGTGNFWPNAANLPGTDATHAKFIAYVRFFFVVDAVGGFLKWQSANAAAAGGRESKTHPGSILRVKKLN